MRPVLVLVFVSLAASVSTQQRPLPDPVLFLAEVKKRLQTDEERQSGYAYVETRRRFSVDANGREELDEMKVFETYPGLPGERRWRRLIAENGKPVSPEALARQDRERREKAEAYLRRLQAESPSNGGANPHVDDRRLRRRAERIDDAFRVFEMRMLGRERLDGHDVIAFALTPRRDSEPRTREGKMMRHLTAKAWVSEPDYELVRLEAEAHEDITFGLGLLARIHKGSRLEFHRRKVNGDAWLPARASYEASARIVLLKMLRRRETTDYSNYRKFTVETDVVYSRPTGAPD